jgi:eukaryotic-like serine/threonine-protein kinase
VLSGDFIGSSRFEVRRRIGSGAFGVVYEAFDGVRNASIAVKALRADSSDALVRFKREFRSLSDIAHRNLVQLYELIAEGDEWLVTMELIRGKTFVEYVWGEGPFRFFGTGDVPTEIGVDSSPGDAEAHPTSSHDSFARSLERTPADMALLQPALVQLVNGVAALHGAGKLHRDIKPSNVLVTAEPRVVLLDFGLVTNTGDDRTFESIRIAGTPAYMSPEQAAGLPLTNASDWYSVGVMLYEALTGDVPFHGSYLQILTDKQNRDPRTPREVVPGVPADLDELCRDLLARDPTARPTGEQVLARLGRTERIITASGGRKTPSWSSPFVGRQRHLRSLHDAYRNTLTGVQTTVCVAGPSGIGKTSLLRTFLEQLRQEVPGAIVLTGRCYQRESVPYKGVDSMIDALHRVLSRAAPQELEAILPRDILAAEQLFPVLSELGDLVRARRRIAVVPDQQELRRRAFAAMRELFLRLVDRAPVVIAIDDLQWGDVDSAELLKEILRPPDAPALLFLASYRAEEEESSPFLRAFLDEVRQGGRPAAAMREVRLGTLSAEESRHLVTELLTSVPNATAELARLIADESGGSPFFIDELVRSLQLADESAVREAAHRGAEDSDARELNIRDLLSLRLARLDADSHTLLRLVVINRQPVPAAVLRRAAESVDYDAAVAILISEHLVRTRDTDHGEELEVYHDRLADTVATLIDEEEQARLHAVLADALEAFEESDDELLADHLISAGMNDRGITYLVRAADRAARALAFDRAARLYRRAMSLDVSPEPGNDLDSIRCKLGDVLGNAGRGRESAMEYLAAKGKDFADEMELKRKAAQQLLFSGHVDEGLAVVRMILALTGEPFPETRRDTIVALLKARLKLKFRGLKFQPRRIEDIPVSELLRVDTCRAVGTGLSSVDTIRGAVFQTRYLLAALDVGEPFRVAHALAMESGYSSVGGSRTRRRTKMLTAVMRRVVESVGTPYVMANADLVEGIAASLEGRWRVGAELCEQAERQFLEHCTGVTWELGTARSFGLRCHQFRGDIRGITERFPALVRDAQERGDRYFATNIVLFSHYVNLAADDPQKMTEEIEAAMHGWSHAGFHVQHMWHLRAGVENAIYEGRGMLGWTRLAQSWRAASGSLVARVQFTGIVLQELRGRAALAAASEATSPRERARFLDIADRAAKRVDQQRTEWGLVLSQLLRAGTAYFRGRQEKAVKLLREVESLGEENEMYLHVTCARQRLAEILGGAEGTALRETCRRWMAEQGIRNPEAMVRTVVGW